MTACLPTFSKECEYLRQSKSSMVTLVNQTSCGVQKKIHHIFVVVFAPFFFDFVVWKGF